MAFQFRLQSVLTFRASLEEKAQLALAKEQRILEDHRQRLEELRESRVQMMADLEQRKKGTINASLLSIYMNGLQGKDRDIKAQEETIGSQTKVVETCRLELAQRMQDRKVMERLREKAYDQYVAEIAMKEQKQSDEQAILRYGKGGI